MKIYIAGPMSGIKDWNFPAFNEAQRQLEALGYEVENPASQGGGEETWEFYLKGALRQMLTCDAIALLDGWCDSDGALLEVRTGNDVGIYAHSIEWILENGY